MPAHEPATHAPLEDVCSHFLVATVREFMELLAHERGSLLFALAAHYGQPAIRIDDQGLSILVHPTRRTSLAHRPLGG